MHALAVQAAALELRAIGMSPSWIAHELGIAPRTLRRWLDGHTRRVESPRALAPGPYAYLLGLYLGDGHVSTGPRGQRYLTISCDAAYPGIVDSAKAAVAAIVPDHPVWVCNHPTDRCVRVGSCSRWWPVLFPQHGPGFKHARRIALTEWQRSVIDQFPRELIRGLLHSDGSRFIARQRVGPKIYEYVRYAFSNRSEDIKTIFCDHLDRLGIRWTRPNALHIAIDRRSEVAKLDEFVGPKR